MYFIYTYMISFTVCSDGAGAICSYNTSTLNWMKTSFETISVPNEDIKCESSILLSYQCIPLHWQHGTEFPFQMIFLWEISLFFLTHLNYTSWVELLKKLTRKFEKHTKQQLYAKSHFYIPIYLYFQYSYHAWEHIQLYCLWSLLMVPRN